MKIFTCERPSAAPAVLAPLSIDWLAQIVRVPSVPQVHQVQDQAKLTLAALPVEFQGTSGSTGERLNTGLKRMYVRGVPPRGRPV